MQRTLTLFAAVSVAAMLALALPGPAQAQNPNLGTAGAQFLQIPVGAQAVGMAGAYLGMAEDAVALFWNPAGITYVERQAVHFSHLQWFATVHMTSVAYVLNLERWGVFGVSANSLGMDKMEVTTELQPEGSGEFWDAQDVSLGVTYARGLTDRMSVGVTAKYVRQRIWHESASGVAFDVGTQYRLDFRQLVIAMAMTNFGADLRLDGRDLDVVHDRNVSIPRNRLTPARLQTETYPLPLHFQVGIAFDVYRSPFLALRAAVDAAHPNDNNERINLGAELALRQVAFLRAGYRYNYDEEDWTLGAGVRLPLARSRVRVDYAYSFFNLLDDVQRFSLGIEF
ncbi:MAG: PorV/PorQ family protein [bacterium]|nr:PorV/PorQ family protein [candidate division KSB1 bacterium]MDH7560472.1 PorV/PorQ family protein [bacterium]